MVPIKNIGNLPPEFRRLERGDKNAPVRRSEDVKSQKPTTEAKQVNTTDQVKLSDSARTMLQREAEVKSLLADMPNVETISDDERKDIEAKIEGGFYNSPEVVEAVAGKVAQEAAETPIKKLTPTRMQEVIEKIRDSQYESDSVLNVVADKILKELTA